MMASELHAFTHGALAWRWPSSISRPASILMFGDAIDHWEARCVPLKPPTPYVGQDFYPERMARHVSRCNIAYVDGHCDSLTAQELIDNPDDLWAQSGR